MSLSVLIVALIVVLLICWAAGDVKMVYVASSDLTVTALAAGLASSATWVAGWGSATVDNSSNVYLDYSIMAKITVESSGLTAGEIRMYVVAELSDSAYPDVLSSGTEGTEGAVTFTDTEIRDASCKLAAFAITDTGASDPYPLVCGSVAALFNGVCPRKFFIFITHSTVAALETSGQQVTIAGRYLNVAA